LLSDDGGKQWRQAQAVPVDCTLTSVSFTDAQHGWIAGHWGVVLATSDGGEHWRVQRSATGEDRPLFAIHMNDAQHGVAVGLWSLVLRTTDGGQHWDEVKLAPPAGSSKADLNLLGLFAAAGGTLYATAERGMVLRSGDQGETWTYLNTAYAGSLWTGVAPSDGVLLVAGLRGSLYRSSDAGKRWTRVDTGSQASITAMAAHGQEVAAVGLDGVQLHSNDAGASFKTSVRPDHLPLTGVQHFTDGREVFISRAGVVTGQIEAREIH